MQGSKSLAVVGAALALGALGATSTAASTTGAPTTAHTKAAFSAAPRRVNYTPTAADIAALARLNKGVHGASAQAASCVNPVGVTPALELKAENGDDIGYLYLGYFSSCRSAYAELHITSSDDAAVVSTAALYIENTATNLHFGYNETNAVSTNGGWADSEFIPIDQNDEQDIYYNATPVTIIYYGAVKCDGVGWTHSFYNGSNSWWNTGAGQGGYCSN
jgi:hypothetical protein